MRKTSVSIYDTKELLESWDYKSNTLDPKITSNKSSQKAWWICKKCGASYERGIKEQKKSMGLCKVCTAKETANRVYLSNLRNKGSVKSKYPEMAAEWDYERNYPVRPEQVSCCSADKYWWKCQECGHKWFTSPSARFSNGKVHGCRKCSFSKSVETKQKIDLSTIGPLTVTHPEIAKQWDYKKNGDLTPDAVTKRSIKRVWFRCAFGHSYRQMISEKIREGLGCPKCSQKTSFPEQTIAFYLGQFLEVKSGYKHNGYELDIYIPKLNVAIEYDGYRFHSSPSKRQSDKKKDEYCLKNKIKLIRVKELPKHTNKYLSIYVSPTNDEWKRLINDLCSELGIDNTFDVDIERDRCIIYSKITGKNYESSFACKRPHLLQFWDSSKNYNINPGTVSNGTRMKFWWICPCCGKSYERSLNNQKRERPLCIECAYEKALQTRKDKRK